MEEVDTVKVMQSSASLVAKISPHVDGFIDEAEQISRCHLHYDVRPVDVIDQTVLSCIELHHVRKFLHHDEPGVLDLSLRILQCVICILSCHHVDHCDLECNPDGLELFMGSHFSFVCWLISRFEDCSLPTFSNEGVNVFYLLDIVQPPEILALFSFPTKARVSVHFNLH
jgi:hypothetical protein